jgi:hypothetical protein
MKETVLEILIIFIAGFLLFSFIAGSLNPMQWGVIIRSIYISLVFVVYFINKKYS